MRLGPAAHPRGRSSARATDRETELAADMSADRTALEGLRIERQAEAPPPTRRGRWIAAAAGLLVLALGLCGRLSRPAGAPVRGDAGRPAGGARRVAAAEL